MVGWQGGRMAGEGRTGSTWAASWWAWCGVFLLPACIARRICSSGVVTTVVRREQPSELGGSERRDVRRRRHFSRLHSRFLHVTHKDVMYNT